MTRFAAVRAIALAVGALMLAAPQADAAFTKEQLKCRGTIIKSAVKLHSTAAKTLSGCHKGRDGDKIGVGTDCNSIAAADTKSKVAGAQTKFSDAVGGSADKCAGIAPADVLYDGSCPAPCASVGAIVDMADVSDCLQCLVLSAAETMSDDNQGTSNAPLDKDNAKCNGAIGKGYVKLAATVLKEVTKCQSLAEKKEGAMDTVDCLAAATTNEKIGAAESGTQSGVLSGCSALTPPFGELDTCDNTDAGNAASCTAGGTRASAMSLVADILGLSGGGSGSTTTTTMAGAAGCPVRGELTLWAGVGTTECATNTDCTNADPDSPQTCDVALGRCVTDTSLDSGFGGLAHDADVNDKVYTAGVLNCPGSMTSDPCGECNVTGLDTSKDVGLCRCQSDNRIKCDAGFGNDSDDCGGGACVCYFGAPFPLSAGGTPACVVNRFSQNVSGTANVDTGDGLIDANLRSEVHLGINGVQPCPYCAGSCSVGGGACANDDDCGLCGDGATSCFTDQDCVNNSVATPCTFSTCNADTPRDGQRDGTCVGGADNGSSCDIDAENTSFPTRTNLPAGGGYSIDCLPNNNISGAGLKISLQQTTGTSSLSANVPCGDNPADDCFCRVCSKDRNPCNSDADCVDEGGSCSGATSFACAENSDCGSVDIGPCLAGIFRCQKNTAISCAVNGNADCVGFNAGTCDISTCSSDGTGVATKPNECNDGVCTDQGGGEGACTTGGPTETFCDGLLKGNGDGTFACGTNDDCAPVTIGVDGGNCTLTKTRECFLDPIVANGQASTSQPKAAAVFCIPPTGSATINIASALPGPGRAVNQASSKLFCSDGMTQYTAGAGNCP
jgi:hypothetical protein